MSITLAIMAAGIGARFKEGCKQLTPVGPSGEFIMEYSIYDALEAGFDHVVFIIREALAEDFKNHFGTRLDGKCKVDYAYQNIEELPGDFVKPAERTKPWGTGQAVLAAAPYIDGPFVVINADDYYGKEAFKNLYDFLSAQKDADAEEYAMAGFVLGNTLSEHGAVTRGLCHMEDGFLSEIKETKGIMKSASGAEVDGQSIDSDMLVSMNMWGLTPGFMKGLADGFVEFLQNGGVDDLNSEYLLPIFIGDQLKKENCKVRVLKTDGQWFGLTYSDDTPKVKAALLKLKEAGAYPDPLF